ncbi:histidine phosphatase family protein [Aliiglaciecola sp. LCG003]|uniref:SixA phosphatase family protein n=1 Tax=Aliiglaciecola sp. LCG003 TaxID=3053655 RepID=UPI0025738B2F|nr:histidine phosphatase family protein [Aliiglaciecola sp. LCG003]WJG10138.1 histidine phosphatase family protein [Aliiglaciecola sp. LCG003]
MKIFAVVISSLICLWSSHCKAYDLYLIRHFEKQPDQPNPALTEHGQAQAAKLAQFLTDKGVVYIYSTDYRRTQQSAAQSAKLLELQVTSYDPKNLAEFAQQILHKQQNSLIVGHSNTTPELISLLGGQSKPIDESQYGEVFILHVSEQHVDTDSFHIE